MACAMAHGASAFATMLNEDNEAPSALENDVHVFVVQHDGSVEEHDDSTLRANTASGVDDIAQRYIW